LFVAVEASCNRLESVRELQNWKRSRRRRGRNRTGKGKKKDAGAPTDYTIQEKKKQTKRDRFWRKKEASSGKGLRLRRRQPLERTWKGRIGASVASLRI
jgi:hypothetical protein